MVKSGFTLVELVLSVGIFMVIIAGVTSFNSNWYLKNNLDSTKNVLISSIRKSQNYAISKKNNLTWGVCLTGNTIRLFGGSCAAPTIKDDYTLPSGVTVSGLTNFTFSPLRGELSTPQSISVSSSNKSYSIIISTVGGLTIN